MGDLRHSQGQEGRGAQVRGIKCGTVTRRHRWMSWGNKKGQVKYIKLKGRQDDQNETGNTKTRDHEINSTRQQMSWQSTFFWRVWGLELVLNPWSIILTLFRFYSKSIDCFLRFSLQHHLVNYLVGFWYFYESLFAKPAVMDSWCRGAARPLERNGAGETFGQRATFPLAEATAVFNKGQSLSSHEASFNAGSVNGSKGRDPDLTSALVKALSWMRGSC